MSLLCWAGAVVVEPDWGGVVVFEPDWRGLATHPLTVNTVATQAATT